MIASHIHVAPEHIVPRGEGASSLSQVPDSRNVRVDTCSIVLISIYDYLGPIPLLWVIEELKAECRWTRQTWHISWSIQTVRRPSDITLT